MTHCGTASRVRGHSVGKWIRCAFRSGPDTASVRPSGLYPDTGGVGHRGAAASFPHGPPRAAGTVPVSGAPWRPSDRRRRRQCPHLAAGGDRRHRLSVLRTRVVELTVRPTCTVTVSSPPPPASAVPPELSRVLTPLHRTQNDTPVAVIRTASLPFRCRRRRAGPREPAAAGPAPRVGRWTVRRLWPRKRTAGTARIGHRHGVLAVELLRKQG